MPSLSAASTFRRMELKWIVLVCAALSSVVQSDHVTPSRVEVYEHGGFQVRVRPDYPITAVTKCFAKFQNETYELTKTIHTNVHGEEITAHPLNVCGMRMKNVARTSQGKWELIVIDGDLQQTSSWHFDVIIADNINIKSNGPRVYRHNMANGNVIAYKEGLVNELDSSVVLSCTAPFPLAACTIANRETGEKYDIREGFVGPRYTGFDTDFDSRECQFEVPFPFHEEEELGRWQFELKSRYTVEVFTCDFKIMENEAKVMEKVRRNTINMEWVSVKRSDKTITLNCTDVPYELEYCYLRGAYDGFRYKSPAADSKLSWGKCEFEIPDSGPHHYYCGFNDNSEAGTEIVQTYFVAPNHRILDARPVEVHDNGTITMGCRMIDESPIETCLFVGPSEQVHTIRRLPFVSDTFSYHGRGLESGYCGITIHKESDSNKGEWSCNVLPIGEATLRSVKIVVGEQQEPSYHSYY